MKVITFLNLYTFFEKAGIALIEQLFMDNIK